MFSEDLLVYWRDISWRREMLNEILWKVLSLNNSVKMMILNKDLILYSVYGMYKIDVF